MIATHRLRARRRWVIRATTSLVLSAALLVLVVVVRRDRTSVADCLRSMEKPVAALQAQVSTLGQLPAALPETPGRHDLAYAPDVVREYARGSTLPVIVATTADRPLILCPDGVGVVIYENGQVRSEWWSKAELVSGWHQQSARIRKWDQERRSRPPQLP